MSEDERLQSEARNARVSRNRMTRAEAADRLETLAGDVRLGPDQRRAEATATALEVLAETLRDHAAVVPGMRTTGFDPGEHGELFPEVRERGIARSSRWKDYGRGRRG